MPRLVVVMPAKNAENTIDLAIKSTLKWLPLDAQVMVWNDGSTDRTLDVIGKIRDKRITVVNSDVSVGGGAARAELLRCTDSEYVANMDADDVCFPWRFRAQALHTQTVDISFTASIKFGSSIRDFKLTNPAFYNASETIASLAFHNTLSHPSMYASRDALERSGGYRNLQVAQDYDLWLRAATAGIRMGRIGIPCIGYRQSTYQVSRQQGYEDRIRSQEELRDAYFELINQLAPGSLEFLSSSLIDPESKKDRLSHVFQSQLMEFRPFLRLYYTRLFRAKRFGPFFESPFDSVK